jgi:hypothetical protein
MCSSPFIPALLLDGEVFGVQSTHLVHAFADELQAHFLRQILPPANSNSQGSETEFTRAVGSYQLVLLLMSKVDGVFDHLIDRQHRLEAQKHERKADQTQPNPV